MEAASTMMRCMSTGSEPKSKTMVWRKVPKISVLKPTATVYVQWSMPLSPGASSPGVHSWQASGAARSLGLGPEDASAPADTPVMKKWGRWAS